MCQEAPLFGIEPEALQGPLLAESLCFVDKLVAAVVPKAEAEANRESRTDEHTTRQINTRADRHRKREGGRERERERDRESWR